MEIEQCVIGNWYSIRSRNLLTGVYRGNGAFIGVRTKFDSEFLFTEFHPHTVTEIEEDLGPCPVDDRRESLGSVCGICGVPCEYITFPDGKRTITLPGGHTMDVAGEWCHLEPTDCAEPESHSVPNTELFDWLKENNARLQGTS